MWVMLRTARRQPPRSRSAQSESLIEPPHPTPIVLHDACSHSSPLRTNRLIIRPRNAPNPIDANALNPSRTTEATVRRSWPPRALQQGKPVKSEHQRQNQRPLPVAVASPLTHDKLAENVPLRATRSAQIVVVHRRTHRHLHLVRHRRRHRYRRHPGTADRDRTEHRPPRGQDPSHRGAPAPRLGKPSRHSVPPTSMRGDRIQRRVPALTGATPVPPSPKPTGSSKTPTTLPAF